MSECVQMHTHKHTQMNGGELPITASVAHDMFELVRDLSLWGSFEYADSSAMEHFHQQSKGTVDLYVMCVQVQLQLCCLLTDTTHTGVTKHHSRSV